MDKRTGFTLIELVMVIVILAVLASVAIPIYVNLRDDANEAAEQGVVGGVRAGILTYFVDPSRGNYTSYPATLDSASGDAAPGNPYFDTVLAQGGITQGWTKSGLVYTGPTTVNEYTYTPATGSFDLTST
ncbi:type II secretion system protein [Chlamydiota bacterium]